MPKTKRRFIDKKNAVTFHLVHRSQKDPLITDELAPQHVLLETTTSKNTKETPEEIAKRKTEEHKFGIFFDDEYDYLQHLRSHDDDATIHWEYIPPANLKNKSTIQNEDKPSVVTKPKSKTVTLNLPSSVFASEYEEDEGLLRKAAPVSGPRPDLEPDIIAALDDDFDYDNPDNQLDDNFMELAMGDANDSGNDDRKYGSENSDFSSDSNCDRSDIDSNEENDQLGPLRSRRYDNEETKSRFTEYSISSSVMRRNEQLSLLDDRFEKFYENYEENEIGALDCEEIEGHVELNEDLLAQCMVEMNHNGSDLPYNRKWDEKRIQKIQEEASSDEELIEIEVDDDEPNGKKWDCQSMLSTYSNKYNHPKLINESRKKSSSPKIQINQKTGVPINVFHGENSQLTLKSINKLNTEIQPSSGAAGPKSLCDQSILSTLTVLSIRPKDESIDEKRHRKRLLKEYKTERRIEKKANQNAFKDEKKRQTQITQNNKNNIQGNRIL